MSEKVTKETSMEHGLNSLANGLLERAPAGCVVEGWLVGVVFKTGDHRQVELGTTQMEGASPSLIARELLPLVVKRWWKK